METATRGASRWFGCFFKNLSCRPSLFTVGILILMCS